MLTCECLIFSSNIDILSTQEEMFQLVEKYRSSGLSVNAFARISNIANTTLGYWVRKKRGLEQESGFVKIKPGKSSGPLEVELIFQTENIGVVQERKEGTEFCQDKVGHRYNDQKRHERAGSLDNYR